MGKDKSKLSKLPFVSICTPTFNRRPFIPIIIKCFENQTYPKDRMEWIIVDDGTDKIEDLVSHIPQVKYLKYDKKLTIGQKRNITNDMAKGDIIVYMDDDDYYPPDRVQHAVEKLRSNSKALCAGSSIMFIYFKHINKMYKFGPYGPNHATAATFAFKRELLKKSRFSEDSSVAEERFFLKDYTIPFVQLDPMKTILVFSHTQNSFDKKELIKQLPSPHIHETPILPKDFVKEPETLKFFMEDIDVILNNYQPGRPENKPDVTKQLSELRTAREKQMQEHIKKQMEYQNTINLLNNISTNNQNPDDKKDKNNEKDNIIQQLTTENNKLKEQVEYLNNKIKQLISQQLEKRKEEKFIALSNNSGPTINNS
jgi:glycosyltransferase involved in cell wall biosynthesis